MRSNNISKMPMLHESKMQGHTWIYIDLWNHYCYCCVGDCLFCCCFGDCLFCCSFGFWVGFWRFMWLRRRASSALHEGVHAGVVFLFLLVCPVVRGCMRLERLSSLSDGHLKLLISPDGVPFVHNFAQVCEWFHPRLFGVCAEFVELSPSIIVWQPVFVCEALLIGPCRILAFSTVHSQCASTSKRQNLRVGCPFQLLNGLA